MARTALSVGLIVLFSTAALRAQSEEFGKWISLFDGKSTEGWHNAKPEEGHHRGPIRWAAEDGTLTNTKWGHEGNDLSTTREFEDYELEIEYKIPKGGNSGVYLRGQIEVQIFDSYGKEKLTPVDAGSIYGGSFLPLVNAQKPAGQWNSYHVLHIGDRITVWHNGKLIQDNVWQDAKTGGAMSKHDGHPLTTRKGPIMLQGDHSQVWYRNIRIRPLFTKGWRPLWNGEDLREFTARGDRRAAGGMKWEVRDHAFTNIATGGGGHDIWTDGSYGNFLAYYAYRSDTREKDDAGRPIRDRSGNSGFYLRDQWEIQILRSQSLSNKHTDGCLYSLYTPLALARNGSEEWNHMFVKVEGVKIWVWQNGVLIHDGRVCATRTDNHGAKTPGFSKAPFKLQGDHAKVWFTNLWIKPLPDSQ